MLRKTKIVATIGPASDEVQVMTELFKAGVNVARLNFSHGTHQEHSKRIETIRQISSELGIPVAIMIDTKGPEIRTRDVVDAGVELVAGNKFVLKYGDFMGDDKQVAVTYAGIADDLKEGDTVLIDDGMIELRVDEIKNDQVITTVVNSGILKSKKGINLPGVITNLPGVTAKDAEDIQFAIENKVDFIAASFIRKAVDVLEIKDMLEQQQSPIQIISKIESTEAVNNIQEILEVSDGLMVARGDLGVEIPAEQVPLVQKDMIKRCNLAGKPVVTATQMLDSMQKNPRPTRAEASDVANAILDGSDAIMLSGETAAGLFPVQAVKTMAQIAITTEGSDIYKQSLITERRQEAKKSTTTSALSFAVAKVSTNLHAKAIVSSTSSGYTARMIAKYKPLTQIIAVTPNETVSRQLLICWGVQPVHGKESKTTDEMFRIAVEAALNNSDTKSGDILIITAGVPVGQPGTTNLMKIHVVGDVVAKGIGIGERSVSGKVRICKNSEQANQELQEGEILVTWGTDKGYITVIKKAKAIITEESGMTSHAAIVGISYGIPVIVGANGTMDLLQTGEVITVDTSRGLIYAGSMEMI